MGNVPGGLKFILIIHTCNCLIIHTAHTHIQVQSRLYLTAVFDVRAIYLILEDNIHIHFHSPSLILNPAAAVHVCVWRALGR